MYAQTAWSAKAVWINPGYTEDSLMRPCPVFKKVYRISKNITSATLSITALGLYEATINEKRVGTAYFTPGWTSYDKRLQYQEYDIKDLLKKGDNEIIVTIGDGWYRGAFGGLMQQNNYGKDASLLFQLNITYADGSAEQVVSDDSWQSSTGPILYSDIYGGEMYDARITTKKWWGITVKNYPGMNLVATTCEAVEKQETFQPVRILTTPAGEQVIDFGQNMTGWVRFKTRGKAGDTIKLAHAEVLDKAGNFYTGNLRQAKATDVYILTGKGEETFEPHFTWHGFRYVKVAGCTVNPANFTAIALHSALEHTGSFTCSNPLLNQLQHNIEWSLNSNFVDIPTDCPQRSERLGWTGDAQIFYRTASFNRHVKHFFAKWLQDLKADQRSNGSVPNIIPNLYRNLARASKNGVAGWGDAATIIPWTQYWVYGDTAILHEQYTSMKAWVDYIQSVSKEDLWTANGYGDWYAPGDSTSLPFIDQCFWAHSTQLLIHAATVLGNTDDAHHYTALLQRIKTAFLQHYIEPEGKTVSNTQTTYVLALQFELLPDSLRAKAAKRLAALIRSNNNHLSTGFLGTPYLLHVLSQYGYTDVAFDVLNQDTWPSWLYPVKMGATTIWEKWDAIKPDSTVQATSYNHYAYGAVGDWLYRVVAGIDAASPGYKKIIIKPHPGGGLTWAKATYQCPYGKIVSAWKIENEKLIMEVAIPAGTTATVYIPGKDSMEVVAGKYVFDGNISFPMQSQAVIPLYEKGKVPNAIPVTILVDTVYGKSWLTGNDTIVIKPRTIMPTLTVFAPPAEKATGISVIVCSGGSYRNVADQVEGIPAAKKLSEAGITAFVLHYRVSQSDLMINKEIGPLQDAQRAIQYVREHAKEYHIDKNRLGIMGFSAGGHLVSTVGTHLTNSYIDNKKGTNLRPDFMVLAYPVISFADSLTHLLSRKNLIGPDLTAEKVRNYSNELQVNSKTPPAFITHAIDDTVVKVANSLHFAAAMEQQQIPVKLFLYARGGHGYSIYNKMAVSQWIDPCIHWIIDEAWKKENLSN